MSSCGNDMGVYMVVATIQPQLYDALLIRGLYGILKKGLLGFREGARSSSPTLNYRIAISMLNYKNMSFGSQWYDDIGQDFLIVVW